MTRRAPLLLRKTVPATERDGIEKGTRVSLDWSVFGASEIGAALAVENVSGWVVSSDNGRGSDRVLHLEGEDWRGITRYLPMLAKSIRVPRED